MHAGDRFLLCSDGLTRTVPEDRIQRVAGAAKTSAQAVDGLIKATLDAGAPDNVTALIVEACSTSEPMPAGPSSKADRTCPGPSGRTLRLWTLTEGR